MERSTNSKNVDNYEELSKYYDSLLRDDEAFSLWLKYIEEEPFDTCLELASGSGVLAGMLKKKGYDIIASDISKEMKNVSKDNYDGEYLILNMTDYNLDKKFDLILCLCDSFNYLYEEELDSFFKCAYNHLNENGRIIFDTHHLNRLEEFKNEYVEEDYVDGVAYQWTINSDPIDYQINEHFTFYTKDGMIQEHHCQNVFEYKTIEDKMNKYFKTKFIEDFVEDEKVLVIGRKI